MLRHTGTIGPQRSDKVTVVLRKKVGFLLFLPKTRREKFSAVKNFGSVIYYTGHKKDATKCDR